MPSVSIGNAVSGVKFMSASAKDRLTIALSAQQRAERDTREGA